MYQNNTKQQMSTIQYISNKKHKTTSLQKPQTKVCALLRTRYTYICIQKQRNVKNLVERETSANFDT